MVVSTLSESCEIEASELLAQQLHRLFDGLLSSAAIPALPLVVLYSGLL